MIRRIRLRDFKTHVDTTVELGRLTVLVGPNGAGKSSVLTALHGAATLSKQEVSFPPGRPQGYISAPKTDDALVRRGAQRFSVTIVATAWVMVMRGEAGSPTRLEWEGRAGASDVARGAALDSLERIARDPSHDERAGALDATYLRLDGRRLAEPAKLTERPQLEPDGRGLAAVIAEMILSGSERFPAIVDDIRAVVPQVRGLRVRTVSVPLDDGGTEGRVELLVDFEGARGVPAHAVSEGTLIAIGLLTVLHGEPRPKLLLLDDIDQALHPKAQWALVAALRRVLDLDPELQVVATTHSPYLVDELQADEVRVLALDEAGVTRCRSLSDHPRARALLDVLSTGELLGSEGEGWVVGAGDD